MNLDKLTEQAIVDQLAATVLNGLDSQIRDEILRKSIASVLTSYDMRKAVEEAVCRKAAKMTQQIVEEQYWQQQIAEAVVKGIRSIVDQIPEAVAKGVLEALAGKEGDRGYDNKPGAIIKHINFLTIKSPETSGVNK